MITTVARLARWEWFKLQRRWMPWILLVIMVLFSQLAVWGSYFNFRQVSSGGEVAVGAVGQIGPNGQPQTISCADILSEPPALPSGVDPAVVSGLRAQCDQIAKQRTQQLPEVYKEFTLPGSIKQALITASSIGVILVAVLAASTVGVEFGWGTMRTTLVRGTGRWQYLAGKLSVLMLVTLGALLVVVVASAVSSLIAQSLVTEPPGFMAPGWGTALVAVGRAWFGIMPMVSLVVLLTVLTTSTATGMAIGIGYNIAEPLIVALLKQLSDRLGGISDYLLAANISGWNGAQGFGAGNASLGSTHHFMVLLLYTVVFVGVGVWLIQSRDVSKATGT